MTRTKHEHSMSLPLFPIARDGHDALALLRGGDAPSARRESEAQALAGARVAFVSENIGALYERREDALDAYMGLVADDRPGHLFVPENAACNLTCRIKSPLRAKTKRITPVFQDGQRWPKAAQPMETVWQLSISYWKRLPETASRTPAPVKGQARTLRRATRGSELTAEEIQGLIDNPLTAARPQKALDFGLFDFIPPDNPGIVIADE